MDEDASLAIPEDEDLCVGTQTEVDIIVIEGMTSELQELRLETSSCCVKTVSGRFGRESQIKLDI